MHKVSHEIISKSESEVVIKVSIPSDSDYFDGHFPDFPILPAVAQVDLVVHFASEYFGIPIGVKEIKRIKFSEKILPDSVLLFKIRFDSEKSKLSFEIKSEDESVIYSSGKI